MTMANAIHNAKGWLASIEEMVNALADSEPDETRDAAHDRIQESVLSVQVRGGWHTPGICRADTNRHGDEIPEEYEILLSTSGPALRIFGRLSEYCEPESAELQMQDWGTWTRYPAPEATLLEFARCFYFGG